MTSDEEQEEEVQVSPSSPPAMPQGNLFAVKIPALDERFRKRVYWE
jgi:hypothetical protein